MFALLSGVWGPIMGQNGPKLALKEVKNVSIQSFAFVYSLGIKSLYPV